MADIKHLEYIYSKDYRTVFEDIAIDVLHEIRSCSRR